MKTPPFEKARAGRTDEFEQRHPYKEQGDDGDGNEEGNDVIGHGIFSEASQGRRFKTVEAASTKKEGAGISSKIWLGIDDSSGGRWY